MSVCWTRRGHLKTWATPLIAATLEVGFVSAGSAREDVAPMTRSGHLKTRTASIQIEKGSSNSLLRVIESEVPSHCCKLSGTGTLGCRESVKAMPSMSLPLKEEASGRL